MIDKQFIKDLNHLLIDLDTSSYGVHELHGFLTAIIIGPEMILPDEWLPTVFDLNGNKPTFKNETEEAKVIGGIMEFYNHVKASLDNGKYMPMIRHYKWDGRSVPALSEWCLAFVEGMDFFDEWTREDNDTLNSLMAPIWEYSDDWFNALKVEKSFFYELKKIVLRIRRYWQEEY